MNIRIFVRFEKLDFRCISYFSFNPSYNRFIQTSYVKSWSKRGKTQKQINGQNIQKKNSMKTQRFSYLNEVQKIIIVHFLL